MQCMGCTPLTVAQDGAAAEARLRALMEEVEQLAPSLSPEALGAAASRLTRLAAVDMLQQGGDRVAVGEPALHEILIFAHTNTFQSMHAVQYTS